jgi:hypothetical protein
MRTVERVNIRFGRNTVSFAAAGRGHRPWKFRRELLSPCYTTAWDAAGFSNARSAHGDFSAPLAKPRADMGVKPSENFYRGWLASHYPAPCQKSGPVREGRTGG